VPIFSVEKGAGKLVDGLAGTAPFALFFDSGAIQSFLPFLFCCCPTLVLMPVIVGGFLAFF